MLELTRTRIDKLATHYVGNFGIGEDIVLNDKPYYFDNETVQGVFFNYLLSGFKKDIFYRFVKDSEVNLHGVKDFVEVIFNAKDEITFIEASKKIAEHLYKQTMHPKIKGGELYIAQIKDIVINGELCDAVGIFKSESKDTYLKVDIETNNVSIGTEVGINPKKLDKGVLIFNIEKETGYKAVMIDNSKKISEASHHWFKDFLDMRLKESPYFYTLNYIDQCVTFCQSVLTDDNKFNPLEMHTILNDAVNYFDNNVEFNKKEFEEQVLQGDDNLKELFNEHEEKFLKTYGIDKIDNFPISDTAVAQNKKFSKYTLYLDKNLGSFISGRLQYMPKEGESFNIEEAVKHEGTHETHIGLWCSSQIIRFLPNNEFETKNSIYKYDIK